MRVEGDLHPHDGGHNRHGADDRDRRGPPGAGLVGGDAGPAATDMLYVTDSHLDDPCARAGVSAALDDADGGVRCAALLADGPRGGGHASTALHDPDPRVPNGFRVPFHLETGERLAPRSEKELPFVR